MFKKKNKEKADKALRKRIKKLFAVMAVFLLAISTYTLIAHKAQPVEKHTTNQAANKELPPKVYTNNKFGYTLSYPDNWQLNATQAKLVTLTCPDNNQKVTVKAIDNPQRLNPQAYIKDTVAKIFKTKNTRKVKLETNNMVMVTHIHMKTKIKTVAGYVNRNDRLLSVAWDTSIDRQGQEIFTSIKLTKPHAKPVADKRVKEPTVVHKDYEAPHVDTSGYRTFSGIGFKQLYYSILLPGTTKLTTPPAITGNAAADARIRSLATARGYQLQAVPTDGLSSTGGYPLQTAAANAWNQLQQAAAAEGINMSIISGYRSVDSQRSIFLGRLGGYTNKQIAKGVADAAINQVLATSSIPGYSKHHTGYAMDIQTNGSYFEGFGSTTGFAWMSANNYYNAKRFGFIPSYPDGAGAQGPNPEPWEYVYIGTSYLKH